MKPEFIRFLEGNKKELAERLAEKETELAADNGDCFETLQNIYLNGCKGMKDMSVPELAEELGEDDELIEEFQEIFSEGNQ